MRDAPGNRVLMLLENQPYPRDERVRREALALAEAGYRVTVICHADQGQPRSEELNGVRVLRYPGFFPGSGALGFVWEFGYATLATLALALWVALRHGVDVVHSHNPPDTFFVIGALFKLGGKRFVFDHHDLAPDMYRAMFGGHASGLLFRILCLLEHASCRVADHVIATNQSYRAVEIERDHVPPERVTVVRNGPDINRMGPVTPDPALRARAGTI
ncbi:MAG TPA: glycosyltransferase, partial [Nitrolancea sp.]|nr:glycosyltransferase [Nitrolancea sp.]